jgi:hypothetical protein
MERWAIQKRNTLPKRRESNPKRRDPKNPKRRDPKNPKNPNIPTSLPT